jgi:hypothetical protein
MASVASARSLSLACTALNLHTVYPPFREGLGVGGEGEVRGPHFRIKVRRSGPRRAVGVGPWKEGPDEREGGGYVPLPDSWVYLMPDIGWAPGDGTLIEALPCDSELTPHAKYMRPFGTCGYSHSGIARVPSARSLIFLAHRGPPIVTIAAVYRRRLRN